jgi:hypothetical protein
MNAVFKYDYFQQILLKLWQVLQKKSKKPFIAFACDFFVTMLWKFTQKNIEPKVIIKQ